MTRSNGRSASAQAFLALSCVGSFIAPLGGSAALAQQAEPARALGGVTVTDTAIVEEKVVQKQETPKATRPVLDTPQTITIISAEVIRQQALLTLRDVLSTVPGITFGAGEGGGGYGDSINLRGYAASNDITTDGVRDSAQYTRTDPFNLEQIEVTSGANSVNTGSGSVGGSINIVTKRPLATNQAIVAAGVGTDEYYRGTVDINRRVSDLIAVRLNGMAHKNDVPGRDVENYRRWGIAPSITLGIEGPTSLTFLFTHQEDNNIPQYGVPYYQTANALGVITNKGPVSGVDRSSYYGYRNIDAQDSNVDQFTTIFGHKFNDNLTVRNLTRYQDVTQTTLANPPQGTYCVLATGLTPSGGACGTTPPGFYLPSGPRGTTRNTRNQIGYNQTDFSGTFNTGSIQHTATFGFSASWEKYDLDSGTSLRNADGTVAFPALPLINIADPNNIVRGPGALLYGNNVYNGPLNFIETTRQDGETKNYAVYLFDTAKISDQFELNAGLRYEKNDGLYRADTVTATTVGAIPRGTVTRGTTVKNEDNLFSYRIGAVYKPVPSVTVYAAYGNSKTPSKSSVNGSCTIAGVNGATQSTCNVKPEGAVTYEVGAKAQVLSGVLLTIAAFRNERDQYKVASADPIVPDQQLDGKSRVNGISLGATGNITPEWAVTANYSYLDSKVLRGVAANAPPGVILVDTLKGNPLTSTPKHSGSVFTTYRLPFGAQIGYGLTYQGSILLNNANSITAAPTVFFKSQDYLVHSAFLNYDITRGLSAQLNVKNFTDKTYYTRLRNNGWATPGDGRAAILTLTYRL